MAKFRSSKGWESARAPFQHTVDDDPWDEVLKVKSNDPKQLHEPEQQQLSSYFFTSKLIQKFEHIVYELDEDRHSMSMIHKVMDWGERERASKATIEPTSPQGATAVDSWNENIGFVPASPLASSRRCIFPPLHCSLLRTCYLVQVVQVVLCAPASFSVQYQRRGEQGLRTHVLVFVSQVTPCVA